MVAKFLDPNTPSWQRRSFALLNDGRKVWATVLFLSAVIHRKVVHVNFFVFFLQYLQYHGLLRSRNFATMATWRNDFFSLLAYKRQGVVVRLPRKYWPEAGIFDVRKYLVAILCSFFTNWPWCYTSKDWLIFPFKAVIKTAFIAFWQLKNQTFVLLSTMSWTH